MIYATATDVVWHADPADYVPTAREDNTLYAPASPDAPMPTAEQAVHYARQMSPHGEGWCIWRSGAGSWCIRDARPAPSAEDVVRMWS